MLHVVATSLLMNAPATSDIYRRGGQLTIESISGFNTICRRLKRRNSRAKYCGSWDRQTDRQTYNDTDTAIRTLWLLKLIPHAARNRTKIPLNNKLLPGGITILLQLFSH